MSKILALHDMLEKLYGVKTSLRTNPLTNSVAITVTKILNYNPMRLGSVIVNLGAHPIYLAPDNQVSATRGIYLASSGGIASLSWEIDLELCSMEWYAIAVGGASDLYTVENVSQ